MARLHVSAEHSIGAPADVVYRYIADFREHHPLWLPKEITDVRVDEGGYGAGTIIRFVVTMGGRVRHFRAQIDEPAPGRVLTETDDAARSVTTFTVSPEAVGCRVRIETDWHAAGGVEGLAERLIAPRLLRGLLGRELESLDHYARARA